MSILGKTVRDRVTGFEGVVTARIEYLGGRESFEVSPVADSGGWVEEPRTFDAYRCEVVDTPEMSVEAVLAMDERSLMRMVGQVEAAHAVPELVKKRPS